MRTTQASDVSRELNAPAAEAEAVEEEAEAEAPAAEAAGAEAAAAQRAKETPIALSDRLRVISLWECASR